MHNKASVDVCAPLWLYLSGGIRAVIQRSNTDWCTILIAHQLLWQNMGAPVSIFQEFPFVEGPREGVFHIHSTHRYQLCAKYLYLSMLLRQIVTFNNNLV